MKPYEVDFNLLVEAVIAQESNGDSDAVSPAGAKGLMQLMDPTGKEWHDNLEIREPYDPFNAEQNKRIGSAYLKWLIRHYDSVELGLAAYNAGPGNVTRAIRRARSFEWDTVKENLVNIRGKVLEETQKYVPSVLAKYKKRAEWSA